MRVLLSGYYGLGNLGDEAILAGLAPALRSRGVELTVLSGDPDATAAIHEVGAASRTTGAPMALLRCQALVSGGGGLLQDSTSSRSLSYYLGLLRAAKALGKRTAVFAQSLGPLSGAGRDKVARTLRGVPVAVRDEQSLRLAADMGLRAEMVADPALLLPLPEPRRSTGEPYVLLIPRGGFDEFNAALLRLAQALTAAGESVAALAMHPRLDDPAVAALRQAVPGVKALAATTPHEALRIIADAQCVVSVRLHGCILATLAKVPCVALSYDPKVAGFAALAGIEVLEPASEPAHLLAASQKAVAVTESAHADLVAGAHRGVDWLVERLSS
ncbi:MAG: polysaccharide pyruvyl transferase CsaB [Trueperaceae bacterium]|nr:polysaccharide pyruvyl transferase CsaB [Trueperaceae bacterium]